MRSSMALDAPLAVANSRSFLFSSTNKPLLASSFSAISKSARFFSADDNGANRREAVLACWPRRSACCFSSVSVIGISQNDQIVAVNDLVMGFVTQNFFNLACMQSFDPIQLRFTVVDQSTGKLLALKVDPDAIADAERSFDFYHAGEQQTFSLVHHRQIGAFVDHDRSRRLEIEANPVLF